jgi:hypothetical protein
LKKYSLRLNSIALPFEDSPDPIDPKTDTIYFQIIRGNKSSEVFRKSKFMSDGVRGKIHRISIDMEAFDTSTLNGWMFQDFIFWLAKFPALKELMVVIHDRNCEYPSGMWDIEFIDPYFRVIWYRHSKPAPEALIEGVFRQVREVDPDWVAPSFKLVSMNRGGILCCPRPNIP